MPNSVETSCSILRLGVAEPAKGRGLGSALVRFAFGLAHETADRIGCVGVLVLDRVLRGETLTVTRDGEPVAELRPVPKRPLSAEELVSRWRLLPRIDPSQLRADIDATLDTSL